MPSLLLAGFEGLGRAAQGLPRGMAEAEKLRQEEADRALREKAFGLQERAAQRAEEDRFVDLGQMYDTLGLPRPADTRVRTPLAGPMLTEASGRAKEQRTRAEEARKLGGLAEAVQARSVTMPEPGMRAENEMPAVDPNLEALARVIPMLSFKTAEERVADQFAPKPKDPFAVAERASVFNPRTGTFTSAPRPPVQPFTPPEGYRPSYSVNPRGEATTAWKPPAEPKDPNEGQRREALIERVLVDKGYRPGTPQFDEQKLNLMRTFPLTEGGMVFGGSQLIPPAADPSASGVPGQPGGPSPLAAGPPRPIEAAAAQLVSGGTQARESARAVIEALKDPVVQQYIGPYAQYRLDAQRAAPFEAAGKIPPSVIRLDQNLSRVKNHTIKLITGAQMSEHEAKRIMRELPQLGNQADEFAQRMTQTLANIEMMERLVEGLVLRQGRGGAPAPIGRPPGAPPAPTATAPAGGWKIQRVK